MIVCGPGNRGHFQTATTSAKAANDPTTFFYRLDIWRHVVALRCIDLCRNWVPLSRYRRIFQDIFLRLSPIYCLFHQLHHSWLNTRIAEQCLLLVPGYINQVIFPRCSRHHKGPHIMAAISFSGVNLLGLKMSAKTQNVLMLIKSL